MTSLYTSVYVAADTGVDVTHTEHDTTRIAIRGDHECGVTIIGAADVLVALLADAAAQLGPDVAGGAVRVPTFDAPAEIIDQARRATTDGHHHDDACRQVTALVIDALDRSDPIE